MKFSIKKKYMYLLLLLVITLLGIIIVPTYAKFSDSYITGNDIVGISLDFDIEISGIDEYEEIVVPSGKTYKFNVQVTNGTGANVYYGIWYKMVVPNKLPSDGTIQVGKVADTTVSTTGSIANGNVITATLGIVNSTSNEIKIYVGVNSSSTSTSDIEYLDGKRLITGEINLVRDINISSITIDGTVSGILPTSGYYELSSYSCPLGSTLSWDPLSKTITYKSGSKSDDKCSLTFTSSTEYPLLNTMPVGSYVAYVGEGGTVGSTAVSCKTNGTASSSTEDVETEAPNSCSGQNAREDLDTSGYTYGYCYKAGYKYYTTGWRIAYIDGNNKPVIVSAGSPECNTRNDSTSGNTAYIKTANSLAIKYCNSDLVDGSCSCLDSDSDGYCDCTDSDSDGLCDEIENGNVDAWAISDIDFYNMTKAISEIGKRLADGSSGLGDSGGVLDTTLYCAGKYSYEECGYNNDLIDNGGYYWFASRYSLAVSSSGLNGLAWIPSNRVVDGISTTSAFGLRPVISLSSTVYVTGGAGTMDDPYTIAK